MDVGICRVCGTRIAQSAVPFYCAKSSEMQVGVVPIYRFETPICDECVKERTSRRVRRYWLVSLAVAAVASIVVFILAWSDLLWGRHRHVREPDHRSRCSSRECPARSC